MRVEKEEVAERAWVVIWSWLTPIGSYLGSVTVIFKESRLMGNPVFFEMNN